MSKISNTYRRAEKFFGEMLGRYEYIHTEMDISLIDTNGKGHIYYPECIRKVMETASVKRMARIFQLGTIIYARPNVSHTRLEHSKGTYHRTLELLQNLYDDENIKNIIIKNQYQNYMLATLIRALLHDVGHGPFSHTMETVCNLPKGFHEEIGFRLIKEEPELRKSLNEICPDLPELFSEIREKNFLGLNRIFEGQADLDRGDFLPRDSFFTDINFKQNSKIVSDLFKNLTLEKIVDSTGKTKIVPVFSENQIGNLDAFFTNRFNNYRDIYYNPKAVSYEYLFKAFAETLVKGEESFKLKEFLIHNMGKKPEEIDLQEYIKFNDVEYLKGIMEVADKTQNPALRKLALMSLPPRKKLEDFYYGLMVSVEQIDEEGNRKYTNESDENFVKRLVQLGDSEQEYQENCLTLNNNSIENIEAVLQELKSTLQIKDKNLEAVGIFSWTLKNSSYKNKPGEETYVKGKDGKIYEYSKHPERKAPIIQEDMPGFCLMVPMLEANGYSKEQIDKAREIIKTHNKQIQQEEPNKF